MKYNIIIVILYNVIHIISCRPLMRGTVYLQNGGVNVSILVFCLYFLFFHHQLNISITLKLDFLFIGGDTHLMAVPHCRIRQNKPVRNPWLAPICSNPLIFVTHKFSIFFYSCVACSLPVFCITSLR